MIIYLCKKFPSPVYRKKLFDFNIDKSVLIIAQKSFNTNKILMK